LFDLPDVVQQTELFFQEHPMEPKQTPKDLSPEVRQKLDAMEHTPYWRGIYDWTLLKFKKGDTSEAEGALFVKIREGQIWRLFTPCILHLDLLHILFNMIWLWVLGRSIEQRIGSLRTLWLTCAVALISNVVQYLMSGPFFLGYSGVVMGLAGFIWMREKVAPWEGYPLPRSTIWFLGFYVVALFVLQTVSFFIQLLSDYPFTLNIANSAHIAGALVGALLGRLSYFAWRVK
jgi:GlpG protein